MNRFLQTMRAPALIWTAVALTVAVIDPSPAAHIGLAVLAAACVLGLPQPLYVRIASALAMVPVAFADAPTWSFVVAGGLLAAALARPAKGSLPAPLEQIQRHLEWCRRRGEPAHLLWVHGDDIDRETATAALGAFRVTDNVAVLHEGDGQEEIVAMIDHTSFERVGLERRLRAQLGDAPGLGWATFPDDGVTLEALFQAARAAAVATAAPSAHPKAQLSTSIRRWGSTSPTRAPARSPNRG